MRVRRGHVPHSQHIHRPKKRKVEKENSSSTLKKILCIAAIILLILTPLAYFGVLYMQPTHRAPGSSMAVTRFPHHAEGFVHPGVWALKKHPVACGMVTGTRDLEKCPGRAAFALKHVLDHPELREEALSETALKERGYTILADDQPIHVGFNPQKRRNQKNAIAYIEREVLSGPGLLEMDILEVSRKIHTLLLEDLPGIAKGGKYREQFVLVQPGDNGIDPERM